MALIRACTVRSLLGAQGGSRYVEPSAARTKFLALDCDSCAPMAGQQRWPCGAVMTRFVGAREKTTKARPTRARTKEAMVERVAKVAREAKSKSDGKSTNKGKCPLKQRLVSRTQCRMCGEEGHWEEESPQTDVDMPQAKRRVTFSRPNVGVGVSQAWCVETWTVSPSTDTAKARLKSWTSQEIQESTHLMGVTMTMPDWHAIPERWQLLSSHHRVRRHTSPCSCG